MGKAGADPPFGPRYRLFNIGNILTLRRKKTLADAEVVCLSPPNVMIGMWLYKNSPSLFTYRGLLPI